MKALIEQITCITRGHCKLTSRVLKFLSFAYIYMHKKEKKNLCFLLFLSCVGVFVKSYDTQCKINVKFQKKCLLVLFIYFLEMNSAKNS